VDDYPKDLANKVYLMNSFEVYMMDRLFGDAEYTYQDTTLKTGMVFVTRYLRMKHVLLFRLSNNVLQVRSTLYSLPGIRTELNSSITLIIRN
jgi:hypothetical protein